MNINLTPENQAALDSICQLLGVSRTYYVNHLVGSFVRSNLEPSQELDFLSEEVAGEIYVSLAAADGVAERFNELVVERQLSGEAKFLATAEAVRVKQGFKVRVDYLRGPDWRTMPQLGN